MDLEAVDDPVSLVALPFVFGMAVGLAVGRVLLSVPAGIALGVALTALLVGARLKLADAGRETRTRG